MSHAPPSQPPSHWHPVPLAPVLVYAMLTRPRHLKRLKPDELKFQSRLTAARRSLSRVVKEHLVAAAGNPYATMMWTRHEATGEQKIVFLYGVELEGWPAGVALESPGHISSIRKLDRLRAGFESGAIWFRRVPAAEVARRERELGIAHDESRRARCDAWQVRHLRPVETRSKLLRNGTGIHTAEWIREEPVWSDVEDVEGADK